MKNSLNTLVDVMRVSADGDPLSALVKVGRRHAVDVSCDVLVVGGGMGGCAAAVAAARHGCSVCLVEETDWVGGQMTSQGVSALDEHVYIENFGGTASYYRLREGIRSAYRARADSSVEEPFNPGSCWVTQLAFEPRAALECLDNALAQTGLVTRYMRAKAGGAVVDADNVSSVTVVSLIGDEAWRFRPKVVLDATELGDLLPLTGTEYRVGAETIAETGEPHAQPVIHRPECVQSYTYTFALERRPAGELHAIAAPEKYAYFRNRQPYSLRIQVHGGEIYAEESGWLNYTVFERMPGTKGSLWTYRRLIDSRQFPGEFANDISMINWPGNDYRDESLIDRPAEDIARALQEAKRVSLGFLHWLQTEAPADGERRGAPELVLQPDLMGSFDGLSKHPYIREGRRLRALKTITEQELAVDHQPGLRAEHFPDSIGVGWYPIDIHPAPGDVGLSCRTRPFQIPLGALLPVRTANLVAAGKSIGTTHISNGCYRLHPVEWNVGEAAGCLAAYAIKNGMVPRAVRADRRHLVFFQQMLLRDGIPLAWLTDVPVGDPRFVRAQTTFMEDPSKFSASLDFRQDSVS